MPKEPDPVRDLVPMPAATGAQPSVEEAPVQPPSHRRTTVVYGIDYGSRRAGTTVIARWTPELPERKVDFGISERKADADLYVQTHFLRDRPQHVFLDAPLSLPGIYTGLPDHHDYFYRRCDRELGAMSPMFLGGLTARAMRLAAFFRKHDCAVHEVYPGALARDWKLKDLNYKEQKGYLPDVITALRERLKDLPFTAKDLRTWHHVDALLALVSGVRFLRAESLIVGHPAEGVIVV